MIVVIPMTKVAADYETLLAVSADTLDQGDIRTALNTLWDAGSVDGFSIDEMYRANGWTCPNYGWGMDL